MARKSRKQNNNVEMQNTNSSLIHVASYIRLSFEDRGTSIENQQLLITDYIDEHSGFELYDTYIDAGVSGTTFQRPSFQRMLRDAEAGRISCVIIKDLSRLGRNAIDTGYYVEKLFPILGIRLISITDNYDSAIDTGSIRLPLTNLLNETYAYDISLKTKSQKRQYMKDGVYVGGRPPYGYMRSPDDKHRLIIDTFAAETVRQIFIWAADGISIFEITRRLYSSNIKSPAAYIAERSMSNKTCPTISGLWHTGTVKKILENEIYLGRLVQGKTKGINFVRQQSPADEWVRFDRAHEAIVSAEIFQAVHEQMSKSQNGTHMNVKASYSPNIFKGKIYCAHCDGYLERRKNHDKYIYYCVANRIAPDSCVGNRIGENDVKLAVLEQLLQCKERINDDSMPSASTDIVRELRFAEMELSRIQDINRGLYENLVNGVLNETEYRELKSDYQVKVDTLTQCVSELKQKLDDEKHKKANFLKSLRMLNELAESMVLAKEHIDLLIQRIEVFKDGRIYVGLQFD